MTTKTPTKRQVRPYRIEARFNEQTFKKQTNDIAKSLLELKPEQLYTDVYITVKKGEHTMERHLNLKQGKNLFMNEDFLDIFINNLILI